MIAHIRVWRIQGFMLAFQDAGNAGGDSSQNFALHVQQKPFAFNLSFWKGRGHSTFLLEPRRKFRPYKLQIEGATVPDSRQTVKIKVNPESLFPQVLHRPRHGMRPCQWHLTPPGTRLPLPAALRLHHLHNTAQQLARRIQPLRTFQINRQRLE